MIEPTSNLMEQAGIISFFDNCGIELQDILPVIFSCEGNAATMGVYKKAEFVAAMQNLGLLNENDFKAKAKEIRSRYLQSNSLFTKVYKYAFGYMAQGNKFLPKAMAAMMLRVLVGGRYPLSSLAIEYLNSEAVIL